VLLRRPRGGSTTCGSTIPGGESSPTMPDPELQSLHPMLRFENQEIDDAYERECTPRRLTSLVVAAAVGVWGGAVRLTRVALGVETAHGAYDALQINLFVLHLLANLVLAAWLFQFHMCSKNAHVPPKTENKHSEDMQRNPSQRLVLASVFCGMEYALMFGVAIVEVLSADKCPNIQVTFIIAVIFTAAPFCLGFVLMMPPCQYGLACVLLTTPVLVSECYCSIRFVLVALQLIPTALVYFLERTKRLGFARELYLRLQCQKAAADIAESKAKTAVLEERLRAETVLRLTQNELTKSQSHRAKLEAVCAVSGDLHPQVDEPGEVAGATGILKITRVQRAAKVTEAWAAFDTVPWKHVTREAEQGNEPRMPCLAATTTDGRHFTAHLLRADGLATKTSKIKPGTHVFVKVHGEPHIRIGLLAQSFGCACGHPQLASESEVLYAGEVEFDSDQAVIKWNNLSGTYKCSDSMAYQAGLPLEKFYRVSEPPPEDESDRRHYICIHTKDTSSEIWLKKVLSFEESDLIATRNKWMQWVHSNPDAAEIYHHMKELVSQIHDAIDRYGLYSELSI